ncbi:non-homologous end-joining DNA ligase [Stackebrandtia soli]|uniref:non-homologous end-joining DNA ligase n=1 Tax=Stackebrandtia soli TaxID=1892856 RepID=UPI0039EC6D6A
MAEPKRVKTTVEGRQLSLSNLDKVMYPGDERTKRDVIDYYTKISGVLLPQLADRAITRIRYPDGVDNGSFYEKNAPRHTPDWVRTARIATPGSSRGHDHLDFVVAEDVPTLVWLSNLAALELHAFGWKVTTENREPDRLVADLDPGEGAGWVDCVEVALLLRDRLAEDGLVAYPKSSGKKGLHLTCPIAAEQTDTEVSAYARAVAYEMQDRHPDLIVAKMRKVLREGKVFIDWSQNNAAKTTVSAYSLRNRSSATVSTPMTWDEVEAETPGTFTPEEVLERIDELGDLYADVLVTGPRVPEE